MEASCSLKHQGSSIVAASCHEQAVLRQNSPVPACTAWCGQRGVTFVRAILSVICPLHLSHLVANRFGQLQAITASKKGRRAAARPLAAMLRWAPWITILGCSLLVGSGKPERACYSAHPHPLVLGPGALGAAPCSVKLAARYKSAGGQPLPTATPATAQQAALTTAHPWRHVPLQHLQQHALQKRASKAATACR